MLYLLVSSLKRNLLGLRHSWHSLRHFFVDISKSGATFVGSNLFPCFSVSCNEKEVHGEFIFCHFSLIFFNARIILVLFHFQRKSISSVRCFTKCVFWIFKCQVWQKTVEIIINNTSYLQIF